MSAQAQQVKDISQPISKLPSMWSIYWKELKRDPLALICFFYVIILVSAVFIFAPYFNGNPDYMTMDLWNRLAPPGDGHILGRDSGGRDMLAMLTVGARNSLIIGMSVTFFTFVVGIALGLIAGFYGGHVDNVMMRIGDTWSIIPGTMLIITLITITEVFTIPRFILFLSLFGWAGRMRLIRSMALGQRGLDYISASKTLGTRNPVIIVREMMPNLVSIIVLNAVLTTAGNIGIETGLSLLGFGLPVGTPSIGAIMAYAMDPQHLQNRPHLWVPAVILLITLTVSISFIGNVLSRSADARQRRA
jgi:peptide/nickel transport system permease protein